MTLTILKIIQNKLEQNWACFRFPQIKFRLYVFIIEVVILLYAIRWHRVSVCPIDFIHFDQSINAVSDGLISAIKLLFFPFYLVSIGAIPQTCHSISNFKVN